MWDRMGSIDGARSLLLNVRTTPEIYTLSLHDALPISVDQPRFSGSAAPSAPPAAAGADRPRQPAELMRSEEHTSELQSRRDLVCRLLLEKKKRTSQTRWARHLSRGRLDHARRPSGLQR